MYLHLIMCLEYSVQTSKYEIKATLKSKWHFLKQMCMKDIEHY